MREAAGGQRVLHGPKGVEMNMDIDTNESSTDSSANGGDAGKGPAESGLARPSKANAVPNAIKK